MFGLTRSRLEPTIYRIRCGSIGNLAFFHNVNENEYVSAFLVPFELISSVQTHTIKSATAFCCFAGCNVIIYPGAFEDYDTGPLEWDVLNKARAIDNQMYVLSAAPGRNTTSGHISFAHSMVVDP